MSTEEENSAIDFFRELVAAATSIEENVEEKMHFPKRQRQDPTDGQKGESKRPKKDSQVSSDDNAPYEVKLNENSVAHGNWDKDSGRVEMVQLRGNFWRNHGHCENQRNYLYAEEALLLLERSLLMVKRNGERMPLHVFYEEVVQKISMEAYLTYSKLKALDFVTFRFNRAIRVFRDEKDVYTCAASQPTAPSLLSLVVSFKLYTHEFKWAKKMMAEKPPVAYVIITNGNLTFPSALLLRLLDEAAGVPLIFAAVMPTGNVILEEFTDAFTSLNWKNSFARPITFEDSGNDDDSEEDDEIDPTDDEVNPKGSNSAAASASSAAAKIQFNKSNMTSSS